MGMSNHLLEYALSQCTVHFLGFRSDLRGLLNSGWQLYSDYDVQFIGHTVMLRHGQLNLGAFIPPNRFDNGVLYGPLPITRVFGGESNIVIQGNIGPLVPLSPKVPDFIGDDIESSIDAMDMIKTIPMRMLFTPEKAEELIVEPHQVSEMMDKIIAAQRPRQKELRDEYTRENRITRTAAKIITLADYK